jgi:hypothetical protein
VDQRGNPLADVAVSLDDGIPFTRSDEKGHILLPKDPKDYAGLAFIGPKSRRLIVRAYGERGEVTLADDDRVTLEVRAEGEETAFLQKNLLCWDDVGLGCLTEATGTGAFRVSVAKSSARIVLAAPRHATTALSLEEERPPETVSIPQSGVLSLWSEGARRDLKVAGPSSSSVAYSPDESGWIRLAGRDPSSILLIEAAGGDPLFSRELLFPPSGRSVARFPMSESPLYVTVLDSETGFPIPTGWVLLLPALGRSCRDQAAFRNRWQELAWELVPVNKDGVAKVSPSRRRGCLLTYATGYALPDARPLGETSQARAEEEQFTFFLEAMHEVVGRVLDQNSEPVGNTSVRLVTPEGRPVAQISTDANGWFAAELLRHAAYDFRVNGRGFREQVDVESLPNGDLLLHVFQLPRIALNLLDKDRVAVAGADVLASTRSGRHHVVSTDIVGRADLVLDSGVLEYVVRKQGFESARLSPRELLESCLSPCEVLLFRASGSVEGTVRAGGLPVGGVVVSAPGQGSTLTDSNGRYLLENVAAGSHRLQAEHPKHKLAPSTRVTVERERVSRADFSLNPNLLMVRVVSVDGVPLPGVPVQTRHLEGFEVKTAGTNGEGLLVREVEAGSYLVFAEAGGGRGAIVVDRENVLSGREVVLRLWRIEVTGRLPGMLELEVLDAVGLRAVYGESELGARGTIEARGFRFQGLWPGRWRIVVPAVAGAGEKVLGSFDVAPVNGRQHVGSFILK